jgi:hypothetical protein
MLSACNPVKFGQTPPAAAPSVPGSPGIVPSTTPSCTSANVEAILRITKIIFLVDVSGSNVEATYNPGTCGQSVCLSPPTDPQKGFRGGALADFFARFRHKTNFKWGFVTFAQDFAHALINSGHDQAAIFAADPNVMQYALNTFSGVPDFGNTPYHAALSMASAAVANDSDRNSTERPNYFVILLTDGFPTDYYQQGMFNVALMNSDVSALLGLAPGQVSLSTLYYGLNQDPTAISLLQNMAALGGGQFAAANSTSTFKIDDIIPGSQQNCTAE